MTLKGSGRCKLAELVTYHIFCYINRNVLATIVLITHSPELAGECQRIVTIKDGRVTGVRRGGGAADAAV